MLFLKERIEESIEILKMYEPKEGYYLAFSGGKDSVVLYAIAKLVPVQFDAHYNITTADPPEVVNFIRNRYPFVQMDRPQITMWQLIPKKLMPPTRLVRYCCEHLKERGGENRVVLTGVKTTDSFKRRSATVHSCRKNGRIIVNPLLHWNDDEIWAFIYFRGLPYCDLYNRGFSRLGCIGCPFTGPKNQKMQFERWPKYRAAYLRAFGAMLNERKLRNLETSWKTPEDVMAWWLQEDVADESHHEDAWAREFGDMVSGKASKAD